MSPIHDHSRRHGDGKDQRSDPPPVIAATPGDRYLGPSGHLWTVETMTSRGHRIVITRPTPDGRAAAVIDQHALDRMIPWIDGAQESHTDQTTPPEASGVGMLHGQGSVETIKEGVR